MKNELQNCQRERTFPSFSFVMESKYLPQVLSLLKERNISDFSYELCDVEEDFVEVKFFLERKTFSWIEADFGHDEPCVL